MGTSQESSVFGGGGNYDGKVFVAKDPNHPCSDGNPILSKITLIQGTYFLNRLNCIDLFGDSLPSSEITVGPNDDSITYLGQVFVIENISVSSMAPLPPACEDMSPEPVRFAANFELIGRNENPGFYAWGIFATQYEGFKVTIGCSGDGAALAPGFPLVHASICRADCSWIVQRNCNGLIKMITRDSSQSSCHLAVAESFKSADWSQVPICRLTTSEYSGSRCN